MDSRRPALRGGDSLVPAIRYFTEGVRGRGRLRPFLESPVGPRLPKSFTRACINQDILPTRFVLVVRVVGQRMQLFEQSVRQSMLYQFNPTVRKRDVRGAARVTKKPGAQTTSATWSWHTDDSAPSQPGRLAGAVYLPGTLALTPTLSPGERENFSSAAAYSTFTKSFQRGNCCFPLLGERDRVRASLDNPKAVSFGGYFYRKSYLTSTSRFGIGQIANSNRTPAGLHRVAEKIGGGQPIGTVFRSRKPVGLTWQGMLAAEIVHRIFRLEGLEPGRNRGGRVDSHSRYIYIHGFGDETTLGRAVSLGCIHLAAADLLPLFDLIPVGTLVWIEE